MKQSRFFGLAALACLWVAPASADWTEIRVHQVSPNGVGAELGMVEAVDSWFTTLATLMFDISGLPPGKYKVWLHDVPDCGAAPIEGVVLAGHAAGPVYHQGEEGAGDRGWVLPALPDVAFSDRGLLALQRPRPRSTFSA